MREVCFNRMVKSVKVIAVGTAVRLTAREVICPVAPISLARCTYWLRHLVKSALNGMARLATDPVPTLSVVEPAGAESAAEPV